MSAELLPCPFDVGEDKFSHDLEIKRVEEGYACVVCDCGARGPERVVSLAAIDAWNRRTHAAPPQPAASVPTPATCACKYPFPCTKMVAPPETLCQSCKANPCGTTTPTPKREQPPMCEFCKIEWATCPHGLRGSTV